MWIYCKNGFIKITEIWYCCATVENINYSNIYNYSNSISIGFICHYILFRLYMRLFWRFILCPCLSELDAQSQTSVYVFSIIQCSLMNLLTKWLAWEINLFNLNFSNPGYLSYSEYVSVDRNGIDYSKVDVGVLRTSASLVLQVKRQWRNSDVICLLHIRYSRV